MVTKLITSMNLQLFARHMFKILLG